MPADHFHEHWIAFGCPYGREVADSPESETDEPEPKAKAESGRQRAIEDRDRPRRAAEQDMVGQRPVNGHRKAWDFCVVGNALHQTSTPPPKLKKLRKNELAAKAIDKPKTI
ncbi:hypothetical protein RHODGE_RHODGE_01365 [Rhodoplanes serenus]|uniref:Uncharacterized protein n=1 Tax=Rhodoplanes serenus TaxID=200615 RepID=A0A3S4AXS1_9BRAD|nr:hypothetical protein RHODGE_RHODGE_01365 [Rhodoplanes serenus]